jgi:hypothetical protein
MVILVIHRFPTVGYGLRVAGCFPQDTVPLLPLARRAPHLAAYVFLVSVVQQGPNIPLEHLLHLAHRRIDDRMFQRKYNYLEE